MESIISDRFVRELACVTENVSMHRQIELVGLPRENLVVRGVSFLLSGHASLLCVIFFDTK